MNNSKIITIIKTRLSKLINEELKLLIEELKWLFN